MLFALRYFYRINELAEPLRQLALADDRQLLILLTATLTGLFTVLAWETLLPDRKDAFVLGSLPVEPGVILRAKLSAALLYFAVLQGVFQLFLLAFPAVAGAADWLTLLRGMAIQSYILWNAGVSVFFGAMALQGCLSLLLPYRWFLRVSSVAQFCWLLAALSVTFFVPPVELAPAAGAWRDGRPRPGFWMLGRRPREADRSTPGCLWLDRPSLPDLACCWRQAACVWGSGASFAALSRGRQCAAGVRVGPRRF